MNNNSRWYKHPPIKAEEQPYKWEITEIVFVCIGLAFGFYFVASSIN